MHIGPVAMPMRSHWHLPSLRVPWARASNGLVTARAILGDSNSDLPVDCVRTWRGHGPSGSLLVVPVAVPVTGTVTVPHWQCQSQQIIIKCGVAVAAMSWPVFCASAPEEGFVRPAGGVALARHIKSGHWHAPSHAQLRVRACS